MNVVALFSNFPHLINGFNIFSPEGYYLTPLGDNVVTIVTPFVAGSLTCSPQGFEDTVLFFDSLWERTPASAEQKVSRLLEILDGPATDVGRALLLSFPKNKSLRETFRKIIAARDREKLANQEVVPVSGNDVFRYVAKMYRASLPEETASASSSPSRSDATLEGEGHLLASFFYFRPDIPSSEAQAIEDKVKACLSETDYSRLVMMLWHFKQQHAREGDKVELIAKLSDVLRGDLHLITDHTTLLPEGWTVTTEGNETLSITTPTHPNPFACLINDFHKSVQFVKAIQAKTRGTRKLTNLLGVLAGPVNNRVHKFSKLFQGGVNKDIREAFRKLMESPVATEAHVKSSTETLAFVICIYQDREN